MNPLEIVTTVVSTLCMIITAILAWVMIYRTNKTEVSFTGNPVDEADFEKSEAAHKLVHDQLFAKIGGAERGIEARINIRLDRTEAEARDSRNLMHQEIGAIGNDVAALKKEAELANQRSYAMDGKIDRLIEREIA